MSKLKQDIERRKIVNLLRPSNRHANCFRFSKNERTEHIKKKFQVYLRLIKEDYEVYTECIFTRSGKRADIVAIKEGYGVGIEILESETFKECIEKLKDYPKQIDWRMVKSYEDIKNLEI